MIGPIWTPREFLSDAVTVAQRLLGQYLVHKTPEGLCAGRIVETEAYGCTCDGVADDGSHSFRGLTGRTAPMFHRGGISYVYLIYGMYFVSMSLPVRPDRDRLSLFALSNRSLEWN